MRRAVAVALCVLLLALSACVAPSADQAGDTRVFVDSCHRQVELATEVTQIVPSGDLAQIILYTFDPELFLGFSTPLTRIQKQYIDQRYYDLPVFGRFYGGGSTISYEEIIKAAPQLILDMGETKSGIADDMDALQADTGAPTVFILADMEHLAEAYLRLGEITGNTQRAEELSSYITQVLAETKRLAASIPEDQRRRVLYAQGEYGTEVNGRGSLHAELLELVGAVNVAELDSPSPSGGDEVPMEQIMLWDPEVVILAPDSCYPELFDDPAWAGISALRSGAVYEAPIGPYNWLDRPPSVQRVLGLQWLGNLLYPQVFNYDMIERTQEFYALFFHYDLSEQAARELMAKSTYV